MVLFNLFEFRTILFLVRWNNYAAFFTLKARERQREWERQKHTVILLISLSQSYLNTRKWNIEVCSRKLWNRFEPNECQKCIGSFLIFIKISAYNSILVTAATVWKRIRVSVFVPQAAQQPHCDAWFMSKYLLGTEWMRKKNRRPHPHIIIGWFSLHKIASFERLHRSN